MNTNHSLTLGSKITYNYKVIIKKAGKTRLVKVVFPAFQG